RGAARGPDHDRRRQGGPPGPGLGRRRRPRAPGRRGARAAGRVAARRGGRGRPAKGLAGVPAPSPAPSPAPPFPDRPGRRVTAPDGVPIAVFAAGAGPSLILVHGTTADHRTWRGVGPDLATRWRLHAVDRRGRGDSGDGDRAAYDIEREFDDLAAVAGVLATEAGRPVDVVGHSLGGRIALGASLRTAAIRR